MKNVKSATLQIRFRISKLYTHKNQKPYRRFERSRIRCFNRKLNSEAMTLLRNSQNLIPITHLNKGRIAVVSVGNDTESVFQKTITLYANNVGRFDDSNPLPSLLDTLKHYDKIILAVHSGKAEHRARIGRICQTGKAIVACFLSLIR